MQQLVVSDSLDSDRPLTKHGILPILDDMNDGAGFEVVDEAARIRSTCFAENGAEGKKKLKNQRGSREGASPLLKDSPDKYDVDRRRWSV